MDQNNCGNGQVVLMQPAQIHEYEIFEWSQSD